MPSSLCIIKEAGALKIRGQIRSLLALPDFEKALARLELLPERVINPLISLLCDTDELIRWRAIHTIGKVVSSISEKSLEGARVIMRRLIWSLNDESGGIGWGAPEAMGAIMAENEILASEYHRILLSYIDEDGNLLENSELERGVLWGIGRLAESRPQLVQKAAPLVSRYLQSDDPVKRGLAAWAIGFLRPGRDSLQSISNLLSDVTELRIFNNGRFRTYKTCELASELLRRYSTANF